MLNNLSWPHYLTATLVLLVIYYLVIGLKYYGPELRRLLNGSANTGQHAELAELFYSGESESSAAGAAVASGIENEADEDSGLNELENLIAALKRCIGRYAEKPLALAELLPQIKAVFQQYKNLNDSPYRPAINELVVAECEKLGVALLTEAEVDLWWDNRRVTPLQLPSASSAVEPLCITHAERT